MLACFSPAFGALFSSRQVLCQCLEVKWDKYRDDRPTKQSVPRTLKVALRLEGRLLAGGPGRQPRKLCHCPAL